MDANGDIIERLGLATGTPTAAKAEFTTTATGPDVMVLVDYYVERASGASQINITPDKFAGYFYIEGDTLFRRQVRWARFSCSNNYTKC